MTTFAWRCNYVYEERKTDMQQESASFTKCRREQPQLSPL